MNNQLWPIPTGTSIICNYLNANVHASQLLVICMSLFHLRLSIGSDQRNLLDLLLLDY